jgi:glycosyltransferase involved in cell wall biosynthesis
MKKVTVVIPTYNRAGFLGEAIKSVLSQTYSDFDLVIIDNASTDNTKEIVKSFTDRRISYHKNNENVGIMGNWNRSLDFAKGEYFMILGDDDVIYPDFFEESIKVHEQHQSVGFTFARCNKVDESGQFIREWGYDFTSPGFLKGLDYLFHTLDYEACLTNSSTVLLKREVLETVGGFKSELSNNVFDFNMWIRIASVYDSFFIDKVLCDYRLHSGQVSQLHWRNKKTGKVGTYLELLRILNILQKNQYNFKTEEYVYDKLNSLLYTLATHIKNLEPDL